MSLPVRLSNTARTEYDDAVDWYEARQPGLGRQFLTATEEVFTEIGKQPDRYPEVEVGIREAPVSGWPYVIYYQVFSEKLMVISVFHSSRNPAIWQWRRESE